MTTPLISAILPTFNRSVFTRKAVESVLAQTFPDFEVLLIDDGSTDNTAQLFHNFSPKVRYIHQPNQGVSAARNHGVRLARGKWLAFLDSDDQWLPGKLEAQIRFHETHPEFEISQTDEIWMRRGIKVNARDKHKKLSGWIFEPSLQLCMISPSCVFLSKAVFEKTGLFDEDYPACEDYELWLRVTLQYAVGLIPVAHVVKFGGHRDQLSKQWGLDQYRIRAIQKILVSDTNLTAAQRQACGEELKFKCRVYAEGCRKHNRPTDALFYESLAQKYTLTHETV